MSRPREARAFETTFHKYSWVSELGQGGCGVVVRVRDEEGRDFALKYLKPSEVTKERKQRFENEHGVLSKVTHHNMIGVLDHGFFDEKGEKCPFFVMPLYGCTLRKLMEARIPAKGILPVFHQILHGVEAAHLLDIVHRDLKPENILCDTAGENVVVADFGIAHFAEELRLNAFETRSDEKLANFQYAAPEQRERGVKVDKRADIYALGMILSEMFTERRPEGSGYPRISGVAPDFAYLDDLVEFMIQNSPDKRPASIQVIKDQLISRGNDFIAQQRLSEIKKTVVPETELDDPLVLDPVRLIDKDWYGGMFVLTLSQPVTNQWVRVFRELHIRSCLMGMSPEDFQFQGHNATLPADLQLGQDVVDHLKRYLDLMASAYPTWVATTRHREIEQRRMGLQAKVAEEERRLQALGKIKL